MRRLMFLLLLGFLYFTLSCEQNPLKGIPKRLQDGALNTGTQHLPSLEESLYKQLMKVSIRGQSDLIMEFIEGKTDTYYIHIRPLYNLESKYELQLGNEEFDILNEAKWKFDSKKNIGVLKWKPSKTFTDDQSYKKISLPLHLELRDRHAPSKDPSFIVKKYISVIVYKKLDEPEIYKISTAHNEYEKMDDGNFYAKHGAQNLNLSYYDTVFAGVKKQIEIFNHLKFYSQIIYSQFHKPPVVDPDDDGVRRWIETEKEFDQFKVQDQFQKLVPYQLLGFIKQPIYYPEHIKTNDGDCDLSRTVSKNKNEEWCLVKLNVTEKSAVDFDEDIYIKHYEIPAGINSNDLFYKMESPYVCEIYHFISLAYIANQQAWESEVNSSCYLPADKAYDIQNGVKENEDIYLLKNNNGLDLIDKSVWKSHFYKIPQFIKMQLGGYQPVKDNIIGINLIRNNENNIQIYVKDYNRFAQAPVLVPVQKPNRLLFWTTLPINAHWETNKSKTKESNTKDEWKLDYNIHLKDLKNNNKEDHDFHQFEMNLQPFSKVIPGEPVSFEFTILPAVTAQYFEYFDPEENVKISTKNMDYGDGLEKWSSSNFSVSSKIRVQYTFPSDFLSRIHQVILFDTIPFYRGRGLNPTNEKVSDYLKLEKLKPLSNRTCRETTKVVAEADATQAATGILFHESDCQCSKWTEHRKKEDNQIYLESFCSYQMKLKLDSESLQDSDKKIISSYWHYDYLLSADNPILLNNRFDRGSREENIPISLKAEPFVPQQDTFTDQYKPFLGTSNVGNRIHIFFNLQPSLKCISESDSSDKKCKISYLLDQFTQYDELSKNKDFFSQTGVQAHLFCSDPITWNSDQKTGDCPCDRKPVFSANGIEFECVFKKDQKGSISIHLETVNPYIYFLNTDKKHNEELQNYKKTPVKILDI